MYAEKQPWCFYFYNDHNFPDLIFDIAILYMHFFSVIYHYWFYIFDHFLNSSTLLSNFHYIAFVSVNCTLYIVYKLTLGKNIRCYQEYILGDRRKNMKGIFVVSRMLKMANNSQPKTIQLCSSLCESVSDSVFYLNLPYITI